MYSKTITMKNRTTLIDHSIRVKLKLNCLEYAVADYIANNKIQNVLGECAAYLGISIQQADQCYQSLIDKYLMMNNGVGVDFEVTDKWKNEFKEPESRIKEIWPIHPHGNKPTCIKRLPKVLKKITMDELVQKLNDYLNACAKSDRAVKNLSTWLDPEKEYWNDPLPVPMKKFGDKEFNAPQKAIIYTIK